MQRFGIYFKIAEAKQDDRDQIKPAMPNVSGVLIISNSSDVFFCAPRLISD